MQHQRICNRKRFDVNEDSLLGFHSLVGALSPISRRAVGRKAFFFEQAGRRVLAALFLLGGSRQAIADLSFSSGVSTEI